MDMTTRGDTSTPSPPGRECGTKRCACGATVWLTGPAPRTSVLARALAARLRAEGHRAEALDGDEFGARYSRDRDCGTDHLGVTAEVMARNGVIAVVSPAAPDAAHRDEVRARHERSGTICLDVCVAEDGSAAQARAAADLTVDLTPHGVDGAAEQVHALLVARHLA
ncbi:adenylyl-sulfate kinase [Streptomyces sp. NBC_00820]|uniref:adenylyl-sulfate kinase n=1 Tax=Streptomyces sp. NBC_00820 TaxID=2975842 RepID=UPI002ED65513|nr:adenylyl-sulfate kinase [Streptomyces sp. NBC_00820]